MSDDWMDDPEAVEVMEELGARRRVVHDMGGE